MRFYSANFNALSVSINFTPNPMIIEVILKSVVVSKFGCLFNH